VKWLRALKTQFTVDGIVSPLFCLPAVQKTVVGSEDIVRSCLEIEAGSNISTENTKIMAFAKAELDRTKMIVNIKRIEEISVENHFIKMLMTWTKILINSVSIIMLQTIC
jgi:hypothetical protein